MSGEARYPTWLSMLVGLSIAAVIIFGGFVLWITAALSAPPPLMWLQIVLIWLVTPLVVTIAIAVAGVSLIRRGNRQAGTMLSLALPIALFGLAGWLWLR